MKISKLLNTLDSLAERNNLSTPYIVGGLPRDRAMALDNDIKDIDITTGDKYSLALGALASKEWPEADFKIYDDGHSALTFKNIGVDFSNNFVLPYINDLVKKDNLTLLEKEMFSRDFTINTLLQPMDLSADVIDITGLALRDIKNKVLRTPVNAEHTIGYDARRIIRAVKLSIKFDLQIHRQLKNAILKYRGNVADLPEGTIKKNLNQALDINPDKTLELLVELKLLPLIPLSRMMRLELARNHMVQHIFD